MQGIKNPLDTPVYTVEFWTIGTDTIQPQFMVDVNMILSQNSLDFTENYNGADDIKCSISMTEFEARCKAIGISPHNTLDPHRTEIEHLLS